MKNKRLLPLLLITLLGSTACDRGNNSSSANSSSAIISNSASSGLLSSNLVPPEPVDELIESWMPELVEEMNAELGEALPVAPFYQDAYDYLFDDTNYILYIFGRGADTFSADYKNSLTNDALYSHLGTFESGYDFYEKPLLNQNISIYVSVGRTPFEQWEISAYLDQSTALSAIIDAWSAPLVEHMLAKWNEVIPVAPFFVNFYRADVYTNSMINIFGLANETFQDEYNAILIEDFIHLGTAANGYDIFEKPREGGISLFIDVGFDAEYNIWDLWIRLSYSTVAYPEGQWPEHVLEAMGQLVFYELPFIQLTRLAQYNIYDSLIEIIDGLCGDLTEDYVALLLNDNFEVDAESFAKVTYYKEVEPGTNMYVFVTPYYEDGYFYIIAEFFMPTIESWPTSWFSTMDQDISSFIPLLPFSSAAEPFALEHNYVMLADLYVEANVQKAITLLSEAGFEPVVEEGAIFAGCLTLGDGSVITIVIGDMAMMYLLVSITFTPAAVA